MIPNIVKENPKATITLSAFVLAVCVIIKFWFNIDTPLEVQGAYVIILTGLAMAFGWFARISKSKKKLLEAAVEDDSLESKNQV
jgi:hypothetical protein